MKRKKKTKKAICGNCSLYNPQKHQCRIVVLFEGQQVHVPVDPEDNCFFVDKFQAINDKGQQVEFIPEVQQINMWVENPETGEKTAGDGVVKIEYPKDIELE